MKKIVLVFLLITNSLACIYAQIHVITTGENAVLVLDGFKHGDVQWQSSVDTVNWSDISGWTSDSVSFPPPIILTFYRAKITSGTCKTVAYSPPQGIRVFNCGDELEDERDGRKYRTVQIGSQCWFGNNLNVGTMIYGNLNMQNDSIIEKYCYANDTNSCNIYGALYQWDELMQYTTQLGTRGICPKGWHVPTDQEIIDLEVFLGMNPTTALQMNVWRGTNEGDKMKMGGSSGFNANLTGIRFDGGMFLSGGVFEYIYTSNTYAIIPTMALRRCLSSMDSNIGR